MREIRTSGLMSGEGKRSDANTAQATAPFLDSTPFESASASNRSRQRRNGGSKAPANCSLEALIARIAELNLKFKGGGHPVTAGPMGIRQNAAATIRMMCSRAGDC
jgi:hypothetical protein